MRKPFRLAEEPLISSLPECKKHKGAYVNLFKIIKNSDKEDAGLQFMCNGILHMITKIDNSGILGPALYIENNNEGFVTSTVTREIKNNWDKGFILRTAEGDYKITT